MVGTCALLQVALSLCTVHAVYKHELTRNEDPITTFDHKVLGNLQHVEALENLQVPRWNLFTAKVEVGTPPQQMSCLLDSGTADLWLPSKRCKDCVGGHHFHADNSQTFRPAVMRTSGGFMPVQVQVPYSSGDIVGFLVKDQVSLAHHQFTNQSFIIVEEEKLPRHRAWDGVCGLGWKQLSDEGDPLYKNLNGGLPIFALIPTGRNGLGSTFLSVGELPEEDIMMNTLGWAQAEKLGNDDKLSFWVASGSMELNFAVSFKARFLVDTGSAYLLVPRMHYKNVLMSILTEPVFKSDCGVDVAAGNLVVCDCATTLDASHVQSASLTVNLGGKAFSLRGPELFKRVNAMNGRELCLLLVQQAPRTTVVVDPLALLAGLLAQDQKDRKAGPGDHQGPPPQVLAPFLMPPGLMPPGLVPLAPPPPPPDKGGPGQQHTRRLQLDEDPMHDVWVLGGVFLDRFATVFDFWGHRLGLAEPNLAQSSAAVGKPSMAAGWTARPYGTEKLHVDPNPYAPPPPQEAPGQGGSVFPTNAMVLLCLIAAGVGLYNGYRKTTRRRNLSPNEGENDMFGGDPNLQLAE
mmetsp:Transcript_18472/g.46134  ORF Transcript_18472/g.46134 Transcript_18472/m.46134 type:complete len:574 (+) Transcript_18472:93-1814(+)